jgi:hypothetical protein
MRDPSGLLPQLPCSPCPQTPAPPATSTCATGKGPFAIGRQLTSRQRSPSRGTEDRAPAVRSITVDTNALSLTGDDCNALVAGPTGGVSMTCIRKQGTALVYGIILRPFDDLSRAPASDPAGNIGGTVRLGAGDDDGIGNRVYGGPGRDSIKVGFLAAGGSASDRLSGPDVAGPYTFLRGGAGDDLLQSASPVVKPSLARGPVARLWAGPGDDLLVEQGGGEMLAAGPGRDIVQLDGYVELPDRPNLVRTRDGERDTIRCKSQLGRHVLYVDWRDRLRGPCQDATIIYGAKPRNPETVGDILDQGGSLTGPTAATADASSRRER